MTTDEFLLQALVVYLATAIAAFCLGLAVYILLHWRRTGRMLHS